MRSTVGLALAAVLVAGTVFQAVAEDPKRDASLYAGVKSCKMCHKPQYKIWEQAAHAKAVETLGTDEAKAVAAKQGIDDPKTSGKCLKCHSTAYNWTESEQTSKIKVEDGVACESCHGPGKNYKKKSVMEDHDKSVAAGMVSPATKSCTLCHNETSPTWKADRYTTADGKKTGFDLDQAWEKIKHPNP